MFEIFWTPRSPPGRVCLGDANDSQLQTIRNCKRFAKATRLQNAAGSQLD
jgi:hypothetical protein